ncbi:MULTISPECIES: zinc ABC transporter substrate-binding protein AztC [unclassified Paracoccus (in: a-proteobacteria)]|uniref:zinc ABC transporter substrate-binding protein AztC n=1 Tax=unclassified Paracoccus (in: a-proteobacteria) TaxID=2688777 RepID=UPI00048F673D|nr:MULTISPECIES: zinc ABC transporter substrate-binding protein AztC [unclassified Paracoccus (in: a-proteobacteria)]
MKDWLFRIAACSAITLSSFAAAQAEPLDVVATFSIIGDFAAEVGGDRIRLNVLVGPDSDTHVYEPRPADAIALAGADVVLTNGLEFEGFLTRLIAASGTDAAVATLTDGVETMEEPGGGHYHYIDGKAIFHAGAHDPHAWQSVPNAKIYVQNIAAAFCAADAEGCPAYEANAARYAGELDALDTQIRSAVAALPEDRRTVVVAHNAFRYFEAAYGVDFLSPQGISTESEAAAADIAGLIREIRDRKAAAIFAENISDTRLLEQIAREAGLPLAGTLYSDALSGPDGPASDYIAMMRHNAGAITAALAAD